MMGNAHPILLTDMIGLLFIVLQPIQIVIYIRQFFFIAKFGLLDLLWKVLLQIYLKR